MNEESGWSYSIDLIINPCQYQHWYQYLQYLDLYPPQPINFFAVLRHRPHRHFSLSFYLGNCLSSRGAGRLQGSPRQWPLPSPVLLLSPVWDGRLPSGRVKGASRDQKQRRKDRLSALGSRRELNDVQSHAGRRKGGSASSPQRAELFCDLATRAEASGGEATKALLWDSGGVCIDKDNKLGRWGARRTFFFKTAINESMCWINSRVQQPESDANQCNAARASLIFYCKVAAWLKAGHNRGKRQRRPEQ